MANQTAQRAVGSRRVMKADSNWQFQGATPEAQCFVIGGLDVWKHEWRDTRDRVRVKDLLYHQDFTFDVYEILVGDRTVTFAAGEFSNGMWGFYVRK
jgi:hypothetical protein